MLSVPSGVEFSYNGYTFNASARTKVSENPVTSADNRNAKCSQISITVSGFITQDDTTGAIDTYMESMRRRLSVNGANLVYVNKGYGLNLDVNPTFPGSTSVKDVMMGPKPGTLTWWPMGGPNGCYGAGFSWSVTTWVAECASFPFVPEERRFIEVSYPVTYDVDERGMVTITTNLTAAIPLSLDPDNTTVRTVDDSIAFLVRPASIGFMRRHSRTISADRTTCTLTIVDRQIEIPYPDGCTAIEMQHKIKQKAGGIPVWSATISGSLTLSPTADRFLAPQIFFNIASQRMAFARAAATLGLGARPGIFVMDAEMIEDLFTNAARFSINYRIMGAPIQNVVAVSGMWRTIIEPTDPPQQHEWNAESSNRSLANNAQRFRGIIGAKFSTGQDLILDVCSGIAPEQSIGGGADEDGASGGADEDTVNGEAGAGGGYMPDTYPAEGGGMMFDEDLNSVNPESSWLAWECAREEIFNNNYVAHQVLAGEVNDTSSQTINPFEDLDGILANTDVPKINFEAKEAAEIAQRIAAPSLRLRLTGFAVRIGYRASPPKVVTYGGCECVLESSRVGERTIGVSLGVKASRTDWDLVYIVLGMPDESPLLVNPVLGV